MLVSTALLPNRSNVSANTHTRPTVIPARPNSRATRVHAASLKSPGHRPPPAPTSTRDEERQRSGSLASTSHPSSAPHEGDASVQPASVPRHRHSNGLAVARSLLFSKHDSMILSLALPSLLALAADPLLAITDTAFVGQLGNNELAAFSVNSSIFTFAFLVFNFLSTATTPAVATALATDDRTKAGEIITQALVLALVLGGVAGSVLTMQATPVLQIMGVGPENEGLFSMALQFLYIRATAAPAALLVSVSQGVFRGIQDMRTPLGVTVATNLLHLALSLFFIFQLRMGLPGAALSTSLSEWTAAATYLALGWSRRGQLGLDRAWGLIGSHPPSSSSREGADRRGRGVEQEQVDSISSSGASSGRLRNVSSTNWETDVRGPLDSCNSIEGRGGDVAASGVASNNSQELESAAAAAAASGPTSVVEAVSSFASSYAPFLQAGGAVLLRTGVLLGTKTLASAVAMRLGPEQMSTHQILYQVWLFASLAVDSLAISGQVAVAVNLGKGDLNTAREVSDRLLQLGVGLGGSLALVLLALDPVWPRTFSQEANVVAAVQGLAPLTLALLPINSVVYVLDGVLVGANDYGYLVKAMVVAAMLGTPLLLAVLPLHWGLEGVWWGLSALMIGRCIGLVWRYNSPRGPVPPLISAQLKDRC